MKNIILLALLLLIVGCTPNPKIEPGDTIKKCVITNLYLREEMSTIEPGPCYIYTTDCGDVLQTRNPNSYNVGDTIFYIHKKTPNN
jgi:hypothetical protein